MPNSRNLSPRSKTDNHHHHGHQHHQNNDNNNSHTTTPLLVSRSQSPTQHVQGGYPLIAGGPTSQFLGGEGGKVSSSSMQRLLTDRDAGLGYFLCELLHPTQKLKLRLVSQGVKNQVDFYFLFQALISDVQRSTNDAMSDDDEDFTPPLMFSPVQTSFVVPLSRVGGGGRDDTFDGLSSRNQFANFSFTNARSPVQTPIVLNQVTGIHQQQQQRTLSSASSPAILGQGGGGDDSLPGLGGGAAAPTPGDLQQVQSRDFSNASFSTVMTNRSSTRQAAAAALRASQFKNLKERKSSFTSAQQRRALAAASLTSQPKRQQNNGDGGGGGVYSNPNSLSVSRNEGETRDLEQQDPLVHIPVALTPHGLQEEEEVTMVATTTTSGSTTQASSVNPRQLTVEVGGLHNLPLSSAHGTLEDPTPQEPENPRVAATTGQPSSVGGANAGAEAPLPMLSFDPEADGDSPPTRIGGGGGGGLAILGDPNSGSRPPQAPGSAFSSNNTQGRFQYALSGGNYSSASSAQHYYGGSQYGPGGGGSFRKSAVVNVSFRQNTSLTGSFCRPPALLLKSAKNSTAADVADLADLSLLGGMINDSVAYRRVQVSKLLPEINDEVQEEAVDLFSELMQIPWTSMESCRVVSVDHPKHLFNQGEAVMFIGSLIFLNVRDADVAACNHLSHLISAVMKAFSSSSSLTEAQGAAAITTVTNGEHNNNPNTAAKKEMCDSDFCPIDFILPSKNMKDSFPTGLMNLTLGEEQSISRVCYKQCLVSPKGVIAPADPTVPDSVVTSEPPTMLPSSEEIPDDFSVGWKHTKFIELSSTMARVKTIGENCFSDCASLVSIDLRGLTRVEEIKDNFMSGTSRMRFVTCKDWSELKTIGKSFCQGSGALAIEFKECPAVEKIGRNFLHRCPRLRLVSISGDSFSKLKVIPDNYLSRCAMLQELDLACLELLEEIQDNFLSDCRSLQRVKFGDSLNKVKYIGNGFLKNCVKLKKVQWASLRKVRVIGKEFLCNCPLIETVSMKTMVHVEGLGPRFMLGLKASGITVSQALMDLVQELEAGGGEAHVGKELPVRLDRLEEDDDAAQARKASRKMTVVENAAAVTTPALDDRSPMSTINSQLGGGGFTLRRKVASSSCPIQGERHQEVKKEVVAVAVTHCSNLEEGERQATREDDSQVLCSKRKLHVFDSDDEEEMSSLEGVVNNPPTAAAEHPLPIHESKRERQHGEGGKEKADDPLCACLVM